MSMRKESQELNSSNSAEHILDRLFGRDIRNCGWVVRDLGIGKINQFSMVSKGGGKTFAPEPSVGLGYAWSQKLVWLSDDFKGRCVKDTVF